MVTCARQLPPPSAFTDPASLVPLGLDAGGLFVHATYGLGTLADPHSPVGLIIGQGGGGYSARAFTASGKAAVAVGLEPAEGFPAQELAAALLKTAVSCDHP